MAQACCEGLLMIRLWPLLLSVCRLAVSCCPCLALTPKRREGGSRKSLFFGGNLCKRRCRNQASEASRREREWKTYEAWCVLRVAHVLCVLCTPWMTTLKVPSRLGNSNLRRERRKTGFPLRYYRGALCSSPKTNERFAHGQQCCWVLHCRC